MSTTAEWLTSLGMSEYAERFAENRVDFAVLRDLTDQDLKDLGVVLARIFPSSLQEDPGHSGAFIQGGGKRRAEGTVLFNCQSDQYFGPRFAAQRVMLHPLQWPPTCGRSAWLAWSGPS